MTPSLKIADSTHFCQRRAVSLP